MFAKRMILAEEIVCEYEGMVQKVFKDELQKLQLQFKKHGNGILEAVTGKPFLDDPTTWSNMLTILNPYVKNIKACKFEDAAGVWANHCPSNTVGCNLKLVTNLRCGYERRFFLQALSNIPVDCELRWDYGIRDPMLPWTMP